MNLRAISRKDVNCDPPSDGKSRGVPDGGGKLTDADAIVVGFRRAGEPLALALRRAGLEVIALEANSISIFQTLAEVDVRTATLWSCRNR